MSELTTWLLAQIAADEAVARPATPGPWRWTDLSRGVIADGEVPRIVGETDTRADREHIARNDPARVLAECAAKRAIVEEHASDSIGSRMQWCKTCADWENNDYDGPPRVDWPCPTLRALASVYAGADGWQEEWAL